MSKVAVPTYRDHIDHRTLAERRVLRLIPAQDAGHVWLECALVHPKSSEGQAVYLHLDPEAVTQLLLVLRDAAIEARR